jgi:hypothetical protein
MTETPSKHDEVTHHPDITWMPHAPRQHLDATKALTGYIVTPRRFYKDTANTLPGHHHETNETMPLKPPSATCKEKGHVLDIPRCNLHFCTPVAKRMLEHLQNVFSDSTK